MAHTEQSSTSDDTSKNNDSSAKFIKVNDDDNDHHHHANETKLNDLVSQFDFNFSESSSSFELSLPTETTTTSNKSQIIPFPARALTTTTSSPSSTIIDFTSPSSSSSSMTATSQEPAPPSSSVMIPIPPTSVVVDRNTIETTSPILVKPPIAEPLPEYSTVIEDMPPKYNKFLPKNIDPFSILGPIHPQQPWPVTKRLYIYGFLIWPLWIIGILWFFAADKTKRQWARRCTFNSSIALVILTYFIVAAVKTDGRVE